MKALLLGFLLASPPVAAWVFHGPKSTVAEPSQTAAPAAALPRSSGVTQVPVEIVSNGNAPQWVYVQVQYQAIPEPGTLPLAVIAAVLLLRRKRTP